jgi:hypothetical protein
MGLGERFCRVNIADEGEEGEEVELCDHQVSNLKHVTNILLMH